MMPPEAALSAVEQFVHAFTAQAHPDKARQLMRFFKTAPGEYGHGDHFLGITVPRTRALIRSYRDRLGLCDYDALLDSPWHEIRLGALLLMAAHAKNLLQRKDQHGLCEVAALYDRRLERANNWDLVDLSVRDIMGAYWQCLDSVYTKFKI